jgi:hypothetical protein
VRRGFGLAAVLVVMALVIPGKAQQSTGNSFSASRGMFFSVNPNPIHFKPIDTSKVLTPVNPSSAFHQPSLLKPFNLPSLLPRFPFSLLPFNHPTPKVLTPPPTTKH